MMRQFLLFRKVLGDEKRPMFIGRKKELEQLNAFYEDEKKKVACVTGSFGMGKTALLRHFIQDKNSVYFCAYETTRQQEISMFAHPLGIKKAKTMEDCLDKITTMSKKEKLLVVIDQYHYFAKADTTFNQILFDYVTGVWKDLPVKLILCGDAFLSMEKIVYGKKALWRDSIDLRLELKGMGFLEARKFFPEEKPENAALLYGISGGIPAHLSRIAGCEPNEAARKIFVGECGKSAFLPEQVMGSELRELSYYNCILSAMAKGMNRVNQLSEEVDKPKDIVVPYLNALMSIGVVTKQTAITEETNRKKTRYSIVNSNTVFWYQFIVPHMDLYSTGQWDQLWEEYILPDLDIFMQKVFIAMSREYIEEKSKKGEYPFLIERSGNWWTNDDEAGTTEGFDIVSLGTNGEKDVTVYSLCFYDNRIIEVAEIKAMIEMTRKLHREGDVYYVVCAKEGFHENVETVASTIKNILLITLDEETSC